MSTACILSIKDPPVYEAVIDNDLKSSIFYDMYYGAISNIADIISRNEQILNTISYSDMTPENSTINTAVAFTGGRGTGKSSAMQSLRTFLQIDPNERKKKTPESFKDLKNKTFFAVPTIDSSKITANETIIGRVSASMLEECKKNQKKLSTEKKQQFMRKVKEVNELAVISKSGEWFKCGDKLLSDTEKICNMRKSVCDLITLYLNDIANSDYLIITIDDLDMGIQNAYFVMEEIRQFLSIPRVVVLVSVDENLLNAVMNITNANQLGTITPMPLINDLTFRYLEKLFPVNRRHYTPTLSARQLKNWDADFFGATTAAKKQNVCDAVLDLIWRKTMLLPVYNSEGEHLLIPRNLRSLCNLVVFLRNMEDAAYKDDSTTPLTRQDFADANASEDIRNRLRNNLNMFGQYIIANIATYGNPQLKNSSEIQMAKILESIIHHMMDVSLSAMNAFIVGEILYFVNQTQTEQNIYNQIFDEYVKKESPSNLLIPAIEYPDAISLGDVIFVLGRLDSCSKCMYIRYLVEVIRTLWSIRMTEELYVNSKDVTNDTLAKKVKPSDNFCNAIGGFFFNVDLLKNLVENCGWIKYNINKVHYSNEFLNLMQAYNGNKYPYKTEWRMSRPGGRAYYRIDSFASSGNKWCNPMSIYTRLLEYPLPEKVEANAQATDESTPSEKKCKDNTIYCHYDMVLPFHSFDYMYRYCEEFTEILLSQDKTKKTENAKNTENAKKCEYLLKIILDNTTAKQVKSKIKLSENIPSAVSDEYFNSLKKANKLLNIMMPYTEDISLKTALNKYEVSANTNTHSKLYKNIEASIEAFKSSILIDTEKSTTFNRLIGSFRNQFHKSRPKSSQIPENKETVKTLREALEKLNLID